MKSKYKGIYVLIIKLPGRKVIKVGRLGAISFPKGFYAYVGSALNGFEPRIKRHLSSDKKLFWHIDYLLEQALIISTIMSETDKKIECKIARNLAKTLHSIAGFGSSDCKCKSHLYFERNKRVLQQKVLGAFHVTIRGDKQDTRCRIQDTGYGSGIKINSKSEYRNQKQIRIFKFLNVSN